MASRGYVSMIEGTVPRKASYYKRRLPSAKFAQVQAVRATPAQYSLGYPAGVVGQEFKAVDIDNGSSVCDSTGAVTLINGVALGTDIDDRIGRQVMLRSVEMKGYVYPTAGTGVDQIHRVLLVYDRQCNGVAPAITDILKAVSTTAVRNLNNRKRFKILMDKVFPVSASGEANSIHTYTFYRKLRHPMEFNAGNAGTVADIQNGGLFVVTLGTSAPGATAGGSNWTTRVRYNDS